MAICYFVLPKDIPMGLVLPKTPIASAPEFTEL
jgi:hypothetical protein